MTIATEYVRGIPVVKVTTTIYTVLINVIFAFLIPVGILIYNHTPDPAGFVTDFLFYLLLTPIFPMMLTRIMKFSDDIMREALIFSSALMHVDVRIDRLKELESWPEHEGSKQGTPSDCDITFENVSFAYGTEEKVLDHLSFTAKQDEITALVSPSGSGKSTAARLSGGERQRLSVARAILKNAPIILLDKAAVSINAKNETKI